VQEHGQHTTLITLLKSINYNKRAGRTAAAAQLNVQLFYPRWGDSTANKTTERSGTTPFFTFSRLSRFESYKMNHLRKVVRALIRVGVNGRAPGFCGSVLKEGSWIR
jgi:hypothetical protein